MDSQIITTPNIDYRVISPTPTIDNRRQSTRLAERAAMAQESDPEQKAIKKIKECQAYNYQPNVAYEEHTALGTMSVVCDYCSALRWKGERAGMSTRLSSQSMEVTSLMKLDGT